MQKSRMWEIFVEELKKQGLDPEEILKKRSSNSIIGHGESSVRLIWSALASPRLTALLMRIANSLASARDRLQVPLPQRRG